MFPQKTYAGEVEILEELPDGRLRLGIYLEGSPERGEIVVHPRCGGRPECVKAPCGSCARAIQSLHLEEKLV
jgi:hypothetical protein